MSSDLRVRCGHGFALCVARGAGALRGDGVERCHLSGRDNRVPRSGGDGGIVPYLLAANLRLPAPQWLLQTRRRGRHTIIFSTSPRERDAAARLTRERALSQFPPRRAEALPG